MSVGLLAGLLGTPATAVAADPVPLPEGVRADIVTYWRTGGIGLREAAEQALLGGDEAVRKFLQDAESIQNTDNRIETARLAMTSGSYVREAAVAALQKTPTELVLQPVVHVT
ncbi:ALF repeat-containing protein [Streptomyces canus]|uniref:ALF repeat-containing protein n=1 Tax=Streptomyces canus TaxID=58343 RepID=UPI002257CC29|nr:ALF repeat-containing protein [Streptomyces canus]MCX4860729.1 ALF repeat-containing protein [Streptomyces canus]